MALPSSSAPQGVHEFPVWRSTAARNICNPNSGANLNEKIAYELLKERSGTGPDRIHVVNCICGAGFRSSVSRCGWQHQDHLERHQHAVGERRLPGPAELTAMRYLAQFLHDDQGQDL